MCWQTEKTSTTARRCCGVFRDSGAGYKTADLLSYLITVCNWFDTMPWNELIMCGLLTERIKRARFLRQSVSWSSVLTVSYNTIVNFVIVMEVLKVVELSYILHCVTIKRGVELFAITSLNVNRFWKFFHCWKQLQNKYNTFHRFLKSLPFYHVKHKSLKMLQLLYHSLMTKLSTPPFKIF